MRSRTPWFLLLCLCGGTASSQMTTTVGTTLHVGAATSVRISGPVPWNIESGATVLNDGDISFGPEALLVEAPLWPISGSGTERTQRAITSPANALDAAGLGLWITTGSILGNTLLVRGHTALMDTSGAVSIKRWYHVAPEHNEALSANVGVGYDVTELNGTSESEQRLCIATEGDSIWHVLIGTVDLAGHVVSASSLDSLGLFTTFGAQLVTGLQALSSSTMYLAPNIGNDHIGLFIPAQGQVSLLEIRSLTGQLIRRSSSAPALREGTHSLPIGDLAAGAYRLWIDGATSLPFIRE